MTIPQFRIRVEEVDSLPVAVVEFDDIVEVMSSCIYNGGSVRTSTVIIMQVNPDYMCDSPMKDVIRVLNTLKLPEDTVAFMTAAEVAHVISDNRETFHGRDAAAIATAGLSNQVTAGEELTDWEYRHAISQKRREALIRHAGTINVIGIADRPLNDAAKVNSVIAMTESKTAGMQDLGWKETGTTSDAIAIICPLGDEQETYCGTGSDIGIALCRAVRKSIRDSLIKRGDFPYDCDDDEIERLRERYGAE